MAQLVSSPADLWTAQDLVLRFGPIPLNRIVSDPAPGTATMEDVIRLDDCEDRLCELIDGTLVEKTVGFYESFLAYRIGILLGQFVTVHNLGIIAGEAGMLQLLPDQVRIPDVSFVSHERLKGSGFPDEAAPLLAPDLVVEIISRGNTREEMERKLQEYFAAGVRLVWYIYPDTRRVRNYSSAESVIELGENDTLEGGTVLPGFSIELKSFFAKP